MEDDQGLKRLKEFTEACRPDMHDGDGEQREWFNLANIIALARRAQ